jgi:hypothetical protein
MSADDHTKHGDADLKDVLSLTGLLIADDFLVSNACTRLKLKLSETGKLANDVETKKSLKSSTIIIRGPDPGLIYDLACISVIFPHVFIPLMIALFEASWPNPNTT